MTNTITREFWVSASHRIEGHPKCGRLHGHNYRIIIALSGPLDEHGMVLDFGELDAVIKPFMEEIDHYTYFSHSNIIAEPELYDLCVRRGWAVTLPVENTTAEEIAKFIHAKVWSLLKDYRPENIGVSVQETHRNEATFSFDV